MSQPPRAVIRKPLATALKVQLFVAAHLAAVVLAYGVAMWVGSGLAAAPLPPEAWRSSAPPPLALKGAVPEMKPVAPSAAPAAPAATAMALDTPAPWDIDRQGTVRWRMP